MSSFIMIKMLYIIPCFFAPIWIHHNLQLNKNSSSSSLRNNNQVEVQQELLDEADIAIPSLNSATSSDATSTSNATTSTSPDANTSYTPEALADQVKSLPGVSFTTPTITQFSGFFQVAPTRSIHYLYIESLNDPTNDPLILWTNGGPGCSGLLGFGAEFGPYVFNVNGNLTFNPYSWNSIANIIYLEQPAGVGFSTFASKEDGEDVTDSRVASDNYKLIQMFFERFPERKRNEFYVASESFGGHYVPHLSKYIIDHNKDDSINFRGWLVGNPYVDPFSNDVTMIQTYYMHGLIPLPLFSTWERHCTDPKKYQEGLCDYLVNITMTLDGNKINPYALDYPACLEPDNNDYPPQPETEEEKVDVNGNLIARNQRWISSQTRHILSVTSSLSPPFLPKEDVYHPCAEAYLHQYLNRDDVKKALNVDVNKTWSMCTDDIKYSEEDRDKSQIYLYEELIEYGRTKGSNLKMMVFSGDDDSICSTASTQAWIWNIGVGAMKELYWRPWQVEGQTAGYLTQFDLGKDTDSSFLFVTVHGAGHEVPAYRPMEALSMFSSFLSGKWDLLNIWGSSINAVEFNEGEE